MALKKFATNGASPRREAWDREIFCPTDNTRMRLFHSHALALDVCPKCLGVWLDGDEIGKILGQAFAEKESKPLKPVNLAEVDDIVFGTFLGGLDGALLNIVLRP